MSIESYFKCTFSNFLKPAQHLVNGYIVLSPIKSLKVSTLTCEQVGELVPKPAKFQKRTFIQKIDFLNFIKHTECLVLRMSQT